jgi:hypothetical protein
MAAKRRVSFKSPPSRLSLLGLGFHDNTRWVVGEPSDDVMGCSPREGSDGVIAGIRGRPGIGIGMVDVVETGAVEVVLASCASLASRMATTHARISSYDSACR